MYTCMYIYIYCSVLSWACMEKMAVRVPRAAHVLAMLLPQPSFLSDRYMLGVSLTQRGTSKNELKIQPMDYWLP